MVDRLNCRGVFLDRLEQESVITKSERKAVEEPEKRFDIRCYANISCWRWKSTWENDQISISNEIFLKYLSKKKYSKILDAIKLMEENCKHTLNALISNKSECCYFCLTLWGMECQWRRGRNCRSGR